MWIHHHTVQRISTYCAGYWLYWLLCLTYTYTCTPEPTSFHFIGIQTAAELHLGGTHLTSSHLILDSVPIFLLAGSLHKVSAVMDGEPSYTVYIRLPFPRGDFVDPPPVSDPKPVPACSITILINILSHQVKWDASKDESLWKILSGVAKTEIDCELSCLVWRYSSTWNQSFANLDLIQGLSCKSPVHQTKNP